MASENSLAGHKAVVTGAGRGITQFATSKLGLTMRCLSPLGVAQHPPIFSWTAVG